jgi:hypothetical protein
MLWQKAALCLYKKICQKPCLPAAVELEALLTTHERNSFENTSSFKDI